MRRALSFFFLLGLFLAPVSPTFAASVPIVIFASADTTGGTSPNMVVYADAVKIDQTTVTANHSQGKTQTISLSPFVTAEKDRDRLYQ